MSTIWKEAIRSVTDPHPIETNFHSTLKNDPADAMGLLDARRPSEFRS